MGSRRGEQLRIDCSSWQFWTQASAVGRYLYCGIWPIQCRQESKTNESNCQFYKKLTFDWLVDNQAFYALAVSSFDENTHRRKQFCNIPVTSWSWLISLLHIMITGLVLDEVITILYHFSVMYHFTALYCDNGMITQAISATWGGVRVEVEVGSSY